MTIAAALRQDGPMAGERERLRKTFDDAASCYEASRPDYPATLYEELIEVADLRRGDHLLEIGPATGKATVPLAERGFRVTCIELGANLAAAARHNLARFPGIDVVHSDFEIWRPEPGTRFDLVFAATAWEWIDPTLRYERAWDLLRPGGHLAFWNATHTLPDGGDPFFGEIQAVYDQIGEGLPPGAPVPRPGELPDSRKEIEATGRFEHVEVRQYAWELDYDVESYIDLLSTFSGHIAMAEWQRERLYGEIRRRLAARPDHRVRRGWGAVLHIARRA